MRELVVLAAGGHAKVVVATAQAAGWVVTRIADDDSSRWGTCLLGVPVEGSLAETLADPDAICVLAVGVNQVRASLARQARCRFASVVHPRAVVHDSVVLEHGTVVFAGAIIQPESRVGAHSIINTGASVDHDCVVGSAVHVAPGGRLAGGVQLGDEVFVGIGAVLTPGVSVGARTTIGAGAAVVRSLPPDVVAVGVPARVLRAI